MRKQATASPDDADHRTLGALVRRAAPRLIALSVLAGALTHLALSTMAPRYTAQTELVIVEKHSSSPSLARAPDGSSGEISVRIDAEAATKHARAIRSPALVEKVAGELRLSSRPEFNPALGPVDTLDRIQRALGLASIQSKLADSDRTLYEVSRHLVVSDPTDSQAITIGFTSIDPQLAGDFANRLAESYREELASTKVETTSADEDRLAQRIAQLQDELAAAEDAVVEFRNKADEQTDETLNGKQLSGAAASEPSTAKLQLSPAEARAKTARELMRRGTPEAIPEVMRSPLIQRFISQRASIERKLLKLLTGRKPVHPDVIQLRAELAAVNRQIAGRIARVVSELDKEAFLTAEKEEAATAIVEAQNSEPPIDNSNEIELGRLEAVVSAKASELERLRAELDADRERTKSQAAAVEARIIKPARTPSLPSYPDKLPCALLALAGTFLIATAIVITTWIARSAKPRARYGSGVAEEVATEMEADPPPSPAPHSTDDNDITITADETAPPPPAKVPRPSDGFLHLHDPGDLARHLMEAGDASTAGFRTLIASRLNAEHTTVLALCVANHLARSARPTLLIDWSLEGIGMARELGLPNAPGFIELLKGKASFGDVVRWVPGTEVHMIPSGWAFAEGPDGLDADQLNLLLDALDEAYDQILVVGRYEAARTIFEAIQGRFDTGIVACEQNDRPRPLDDPPDTFLGFEVKDIDLIRFEQPILQSEHAA